VILDSSHLTRQTTIAMGKANPATTTTTAKPAPRRSPKEVHTRAIQRAKRALERNRKTQASALTLSLAHIKAMRLAIDFHDHEWQAHLYDGDHEG